MEFQCTLSLWLTARSALISLREQLSQKDFHTLRDIHFQKAVCYPFQNLVLLELRDFHLAERLYRGKKKQMMVFVMFPRAFVL